MSVDFSDERISAFLDGELTPPERAEIESLLATSAAHRQLVDELRTLRVSLQELPSPTLSAGFTERVLKRALESVTDTATENAAAGAAREAVGGSEGNGRGAPAHGSGANPFGARGGGAGPLGEISLQQAVELRRWRRAFWSVSAVAAGLLGVLVLSNAGSLGTLAFHGVATNSDVTTKHLATGDAAIPSSEAFVSSDLVDSPAGDDFPAAAMGAAGMGAPGGPLLEESRQLRTLPAPAPKNAADAVAGDGESARKETLGLETSGGGAFGGKTFRKEVAAEKASSLAADAGPGSSDAKPEAAKANDELQRKRASAAFRDQATGRGGAQLDQLGGTGRRSDPSAKSAGAPLAGAAPPGAVSAGGGLVGAPPAPGALPSQPKGSEAPPRAKMLTDVARNSAAATPAPASPAATAKPTEAEAESSRASNVVAPQEAAGNRKAVTAAPKSNATGTSTYVLRVVLREDQTLAKAVDRFVRHDSSKLKQSLKEPEADRGDALADPKPDAQLESKVSTESSVLKLRASRKQVRTILDEAANEGLAGQLFAIPSLQGPTEEDQRNGVSDKKFDQNRKPQSSEKAGTVPGVPATQGADGQRGELRENLDAVPLPIAVNGEPIEKSLKRQMLSRRAGVPPEPANGPSKPEVQRTEGTTSPKKGEDEAKGVNDASETALKQQEVEDAEVIELIVVLELARSAPFAARPASKESVDSKGDALETQAKPSAKERPAPGAETDSSEKPKSGDEG